MNPPSIRDRSADLEKSTNVHENSAPAWLRWSLRRLGRASPGLAARAASELFFVPRRYPRPPRELDWMREAFPFPFESGGRTLRAWTFGAGPSVMLVHGWEGRGSQLAALAEPLLDAGFGVVTFDAPGHGDSEGVRCDPFLIAQAIRDLAERTGPLAGVAAHSLGALATTFALRDGLEVERAVFLAPGVGPSVAHGYFARAVDLDAEVERRSRDLIERRAGRRFADYEPGRIYPERRTPLEVLHDIEDREIPDAVGREVAALWPGARLRLTRGLGHRRLLRDPAVIRAAVRFLRDGSRTPAASPSRCSRLGAA